MQGFKNAFNSEWLSRYKQWVEALLYALFCFMLPFILSHSSQQLLLGTLVNATIIIAATRLELKHLLSVILFPVFGVLSAGALFGSLTPYLLLLVPFIWAGNAVLAFSFKHFNESFAFKALIGATAKALVIGVSAFTLFSFSMLPAALLLPMSAMQFVTALLGALVAFIALNAKN
ncbi:MAG: hypothetical protein QXK06_03670 [Candidatus Diapherotrites archaeon]